MSTHPPEVGFVFAVVDHPEMTNACARIGTWILGAARRSGGFPIELSYRMIRDGFITEVDGNEIEIPGTGSRAETIRVSIQWMQEQKILKVKKGSRTSFGRFTQIYSMNS